MRDRLSACVILFWATALPALAAKPAADQPPLGQLPREVQPLHYALHFRLDPAQKNFEGETRIRVRLAKATDRLWLHGKKLRVGQVKVLDAQGVMHSAQYTERHKDGVAQLRFTKALPAQELELRFIYQANYNEQLEGLYKITQNGEPYLMTQMEAVSARLAFPGFDEPLYKTPFEISLTVPQALVAVANSRQISEEIHADGWKTLRFAKTPPLPTYLVAFAVGPWEVVEARAIPANELRPEPVPLRGLATLGNGARLKYALESTKDLFLALERYFGLPYPYDKLDVLSAPDFSFGAMENAGLIVFRDSFILIDQHSPTRSKKTFFSIQTHEVAHQWFGNLVTMSWWDDIWLNEAFATWIAARITHELRPENHADLDQLGDSLGAMGLDSLISARRIRQPVTRNDDLQHAFDSIT